MSHPSKDSPSSHADQPVHSIGVDVGLAALDLVAKFGIAEDLSIEITPLILRETRMDQHGVGYVMEIQKGKKWLSAALSRRNFGIDNFHLETVASLTFNVKPQANGGNEAVGQRVSLSARVWFWEKDSELAEQALKEAAKTAFQRLVSNVDALALKIDDVPAQNLNSSENETSSLSAKKSSMKP